MCSCTAVSPVPEMLPGTWQVLSKYSLVVTRPRPAIAQTRTRLCLPWPVVFHLKLVWIPCFIYSFLWEFIRSSHFDS